MSPCSARTPSGGSTYLHIVVHTHAISLLVLLEQKTAELTRVETQCQQQEDTIRRLTEDMDQTKEISKEVRYFEQGVGNHNIFMWRLYI